jgi:AcrR family transcriptional regulator
VVETATDLLSPSERERILRAISELCAERGYAETTVEEVIERSGVSPEAFDGLFPDKEQCAKAAVDAILAEVMAVVSANYSADRSQRDSYLVAIMAILELLAARPGFAYVSFICARQMAPTSLGEGLETGARILSAMLERLRDESEVAAGQASAARAALGGAEAVVRREVVAGRIGDLPRYLPDFIYAATIPFLGQDEALRLVRRASELLIETAWDSGEITK